MDSEIKANMFIRFLKIVLFGQNVHASLKILTATEFCQLLQISMCLATEGFEFVTFL